jgi:hypothetical protein
LAFVALLTSFEVVAPEVEFEVWRMWPTSSWDCLACMSSSVVVGNVVAVETAVAETDVGTVGNSDVVDVAFAADIVSRDCCLPSTYP